MSAPGIFQKALRDLEQLAQRDRRAWVARNDGAGARIYFLVRADGSEYHYSSKGNLIRYTAVGAAKKAYDLNRGEGRL